MLCLNEGGYAPAIVGWVEERNPTDMPKEG